MAGTTKAAKAAIERPINGVLIDSGSMRAFTPHLFDSGTEVRAIPSSRRAARCSEVSQIALAEMSFARACCGGSPTWRHGPRGGRWGRENGGIPQFPFQKKQAAPISISICPLPHNGRTRREYLVSSSGARCWK
jgi:hypothetical protein